MTKGNRQEALFRNLRFFSPGLSIFNMFIDTKAHFNLG